MDVTALTFLPNMEEWNCLLIRQVFTVREIIDESIGGGFVQLQASNHVTLLVFIQLQRTYKFRRESCSVVVFVTRLRLCKV